MQQHKRVIVGIHHPRPGELLGHLMGGVARGGQPGADVEELPHPSLAGQVTDRPACERTVGPGHRLIAGGAAMTASPAARSAAKLSLPPSQ